MIDISSDFIILICLSSFQQIILKDIHYQLLPFLLSVNILLNAGRLLDEDGTNAILMVQL